MQPEKLEELLWKGMEVLLKELDLEGNERMQRLVQEEIGEYIALTEEQGPVRFQYEGLSIQRDESGGLAIAATLMSDGGSRMDVKVTGWIHHYLDWTKLSGGIEPTIIEEEVYSNLSQYDIDEDVIEEITDEVKVQLEERGVRFHEE